jgi:glyceraldehyde-3-phosphate dehydrogenase (NADP+)
MKSVDWGVQEWRREGNLIWPLLIDNVTAEMRIAWEEPFGPIIPVMRIKTPEEGVDHCNASKLALQGCIFTKNIDQAILLSDAMETGTIQINAAPARGPDHFPFQVRTLDKKTPDLLRLGVESCVQFLRKL